MFAYCRNSPVSRKDVSGTVDEKIEDCDGNLSLDEQDLQHEGAIRGGGHGCGFASSSHSSGRISSNSVAMSTEDALDTAIDFIGPGYYEADSSGSGRYVSSDSLRQVRIGYKDITGAHAGAPHINFDYIGKSRYITFHVYLLEK